MRPWVPPGEPAAKVRGRDSFGRPDWHPPSYQTPLALIIAVQLARALVCLARACWRHPIGTALATVVLVIQVTFGSPGLAMALILTALVLLAWRYMQPHNYSRLVATPARSWWRGRVYAARWHGVMFVTGLAVRYETREVMPRLITVSATRCVDRVVVQLVRGQSPDDVADASDGIAHGLRVCSCRVRVSRPGFVILELVRRDTLAEVIPALPISEEVDLRALPVGRREDGSVWTLRLRGTHVLVVGATGAGKNSVIWSLIRAMLPAIQAGLVRVLAADPKHSIKPSMAQNWRNYAAYYVIPYIGQRDVRDIDGAVCDALYAKLLSEGRVKAKPKQKPTERPLHVRRLSPDGRALPCRPYSYDAVRCYRKHTETDPLIGRPIEARKAGRRAVEIEASRKKPVPGLEPKTVVNTHRMLHRAWEDFAVKGWAKRNVASDAHPPRIPRKGRKVWTVAPLQTFLQRARSDRFFALWVLEATSGMRRCELAGARRDLLDLAAGTLRIEVTRVVVDGKVIESDGKTENAQHVLALDPFTLAVLRTHVETLD